MTESYYFQVKFPGKSHFSASKIEGNKVHTVLFTLETKKGKKTEVIVDYEGKSLKASNKFFKVCHFEFSEREIMDLQ